jgi:hypothetical protein
MSCVLITKTAASHDVTPTWTPPLHSWTSSGLVKWGSPEATNAFATPQSLPTARWLVETGLSDVQTGFETASRVDVGEKLRNP